MLFFIFKKWQTKQYAAFLCGSFSIIVIHLCYFYLSWGFNYNRLPLNKRLNLNAEIADSVFTEEAILITSALNELRYRITDKPNYQIGDNQTRLMNELKLQLNEVFHQFHLAEKQNPTVRILKPSGSLLIWGASGVYWPFAGEGHVDAGLDEWQIPFTCAHEMCHVMGWTEEGECNFLAYLACMSSDDLQIQYSAELSYWRYLMANAYRYDKSLRDSCIQRLNNNTLKDLEEIDMALDRYPELFEPIRRRFYDYYLKANGVEEGDKSYSKIIVWKINYYNSLNK